MGVRVPATLLALCSLIPSPAFGGEEPASSDIAGRVVDEKGEPVAWFALQLDPHRTGDRKGRFFARAISGRDGAFRFPEVPDGKYTLRQADDSRRAAPDVVADAFDEVSPGTCDLVLVVRVRRTASGRVIAPGGGPPPEGGTLEARGTRHGKVESQLRVRVGPDGAFVTEPLDPALDWELRARGFKGWLASGPVVFHPGDAGVEVHLDEGGRIEGVVRDQLGEPAPAGLPIRAIAPGERREDGGVGRALTDAAGRFSVQGLGDFEFELHVDGAPPYLLGGKAEGRFRRGSGVVLRVVRWHQAMGILLSADDQRMATERISFAAPGELPGQWWTRTRADGTFEFQVPPVPVGEFFLHAGRMWVSLGEQRLPSTSLVLRAPQLPQTAGTRPVLGRIAGRVTGAGEEGIGGILLSFHYREPDDGRYRSEPAATVRTAADGSFDSPDLPVGRYEVRADGDGWRPSSTTATAPSRKLRLRMEPGWRVAGRLVDAVSGDPVPGVEVRASIPASGIFSRTVRSGTDGSFATEGLRAGEYTLEVGVRLPGARAEIDLPGDYLPRKLPCRAGGDGDLRVELTKGLAVGGRILAGDGQPLPGDLASKVRVTLYPEQGDGPGPTALVSKPVAEDGAFRFGSLAPGRWWLTGEYTGEVPLPGLFFSSPVALEAGNLDFGLRVAIGPPIRGKVCSLDGEAAGGAPVTVIWIAEGGVQGCGQVRASADGTFSTGPLDGAKIYHLGYSPRGLAPGMALNLRAGATDVILRPSAGEAIEGVAIDDMGLPVEEGTGVLASAVDGTSGTSFFAHGSSLIGRAGRFRIPALLPSVLYSVTVAAPGTDFLPLSAPVLVRTGVTDLMLRVARGVALAGTLRDGTGAPVARAALLAEPIREGDRWSSSSVYGWFTDAEGRFRIRGLPRGDVRLSANRGGVVVDLGVRRAPDENLEIVLPEK